MGDVFLTIVSDDFACLRRFQRGCSLATYLTVIARRVITRQLTAGGYRNVSAPHVVLDTVAHSGSDLPSRLDNVDEVRQLMTRLDPQEARVVRMYHLEGMSYQQISQEIGVSENSIGPVLSRARLKMRKSTQP